MSNIKQEVLAANKIYAASFGDKADLPMPPGRGFAILTCMDARLDPAKYAGLAEGDAHVIRNAGGRASDDAIRSLVISLKLLGTKEWFVNTIRTAGWKPSRMKLCVDYSLPASTLPPSTRPAGMIMAPDRGLAKEIISTGLQSKTRQKA